MAVLIVPCPHCTQPSKLDSDRLPDQPASYPCPHCKQKVVVDKRELLQAQAAQTAGADATSPAQAAAQAAAAAAAAAASAAAAAQAVAKQSPPQSPTPAPVALPSSAPADRRFGRLPENPQFPSGIIVGDDPSVIEEIRVKLATLGSEVEKIDSAENARHLILSENPDLCIFVASGEIEPPYEPLGPLTGLPPSVRRSLYLALVGDDLKTLDGNSAFVFEVNMVLGKQDLGQFEAALYSGIEYHDRLYRPFFQAVELKNSI